MWKFWTLHFLVLLSVILSCPLALPSTSMDSKQVKRRTIGGLAGAAIVESLLNSDLARKVLDPEFLMGAVNDFMIVNAVISPETVSAIFDAPVIKAIATPTVMQTIATSKLAAKIMDPETALILNVEGMANFLSPANMKALLGSEDGVKVSPSLVKAAMKSKFMRNLLNFESIKIVLNSSTVVSLFDPDNLRSFLSSPSVKALLNKDLHDITANSSVFKAITSQVNMNAVFANVNLLKNL